MNSLAPVASHGLVRMIARSLRQRCGVTPGSRLMLAVSGGADSVALLRALVALAPRRRWGLALAVAHIDHQVRPDAADDARFVASLAQRHGLEVFESRLDPVAPVGNPEAQLRRARYEHLHRHARRWDADFLVTAHHADDQLETLLMRLLRGASVRGLAGMAWRRDLETPNSKLESQNSKLTLIRPMLAVTHADAERFLREIGQPWREDATNRDASRWRARLRRDVLPVLRDLRPDAAHKAVALAEHLRDVGRVLDERVREQEEQVLVEAGQWTLARQAARRMDRAVLTGLLRRWIVQAGASPDRLGLAALRPVVGAIRDERGGRRRFELSGGAVVELTREHVVIRTGEQSR